MNLTKQQIKQRYFQKIYDNSNYVLCACGCGNQTKNKDKYGRDKKFINGHNGRKYNNPSEHKRAWNRRNKQQRYKYRQKRIHKLKSELILLKGGRCQLCGLPFDNECTSIFDFHHINPDNKLFNLNNAALNKYGRKDIDKEFLKCELLCAVCHRLIHWNWENINTADSC